MASATVAPDLHLCLPVWLFRAGPAADSFGDVKRILLGSELEAIVRVGLHEALRDDEDCEVLNEPTAGTAIFDYMAATVPDVVVLDEERGGSELADIIAAEYPAVTVITCSSQEPTMRVLPSTGRSYISPLSPESLIEAVKQP